VQQNPTKFLQGKGQAPAMAQAAIR